MSQPQRLFQLPLVGTILLSLLVVVYLVACKRSSEPDPSDAITKHTVNTPPDEILKYWTADKMRRAKPARMPHIDDPRQGKRRPQHPPRPSRPDHS